MTLAPPIPCVPPASAPGGLYFQVITDTGAVLATAAIVPGQEEQLGRLARAHQQLACDWCDAHMGRDCWIHAYDGDTGEPFHSVALNTDMLSGFTGPVPEGAELQGFTVVRRH